MSEEQISSVLPLEAGDYVESPQGHPCLVLAVGDKAATLLSLWSAQVDYADIACFGLEMTRIAKQDLNEYLTGRQGMLSQYFGTKEECLAIFKEHDYSVADEVIEKHWLSMQGSPEWKAVMEIRSALEVATQEP